MNLLSESQPIFVAGNNTSLDYILSNGKPNVLVAVAHQDDEVIGMGGTMASYSTGVYYAIGDPHYDLHQSDPTTFFQGGLGLFDIGTITEFRARLTEGGINLKLLPREPRNVAVVYVANGAKSPATIERDIKAAHPGKPVQEVLRESQMDSLEQLTIMLNNSRLPEALAGLEHVGAVAGVFLEYDSASIKADSQSIGPTIPQSIQDLARIISIFKPESIYTHSPFDVRHPTHIFVSDIVLKAAGMVAAGDYSPELLGFPVWNPDSQRHNSFVDISTAFEKKLARFICIAFLAARALEDVTKIG